MLDWDQIHQIIKLCNDALNSVKQKPEIRLEPTTFVVNPNQIARNCPHQQSSKSIFGEWFCALSPHSVWDLWSLWECDHCVPNKRKFLLHSCRFNLSHRYVKELWGKQQHKTFTTIRMLFFSRTVTMELLEHLSQSLFLSAHSILAATAATHSHDTTQISLWDVFNIPLKGLQTLFHQTDVLLLPFFSSVCHSRSQLSICSEPAITLNKQLSCQSSIEPSCVPEEDQIDTQPSSSSCVVIELRDNQQVIVDKRNRPDSLILKTTTIDSTTPVKTTTKKFLQRSQSTNVYKTSSSKGKSTRVMSNDLDQIYVISSSNNCMQSDLEDYYDSIDVIHERRSKNFSRFNDSETDKDKESATTTCRIRNENIVETIVDIEPRRCDETA